MSEEKKRTTQIRLYDIKEPDRWNELCDILGVPEGKRRAHFEYGEYANIEIEIDSDLRIVGGRVLSLKECK